MSYKSVDYEFIYLNLSTLIYTIEDILTLIMTYTVKEKGSLHIKMKLLLKV